MRILWNPKNLNKHSKSFFFISGVIAILLIGTVLYLTKSELALSLIYLFPIIIITWFISKEAGVLVSIISTVSWFATDLIIIKNFSSQIIPYVNGLFRFLLFLFVVFILSELRQTIDDQKELAGTDPLTGIANRRAFYILANAEVSRAARYKYSFSTAYIDLDNFKIINDRFGHSTGDNLLCNVAKTIKTNTRAVDIVTRLGGDEFIVLFSRIESDIAHYVVNRLKNKLSNVMMVNGWPVTFSIGLATYNKPPESVDDLIRESDALMYSAKRDGKNKIECRVI